MRCILLRVFGILCLLPCTRMTASHFLVFTSRGSYKHCVTASRVLDHFNTTWCDHPPWAERVFSTPHNMIYSTTIMVTAKKQTNGNLVAEFTK